MAEFRVDGDELRLDFSTAEKVGGLRAGAQIPLRQVASVKVVDDPWSILKGLRVGTGLPYVIVLGTMVRAGSNDVVAVYGRKPAVVVEMREGARYARLIATVDDPAQVASHIEEARTQINPLQA